MLSDLWVRDQQKTVVTSGEKRENRCETSPTGKKEKTVVRRHQRGKKERENRYDTSPAGKKKEKTVGMSLSV